MRYPRRCGVAPLGLGLLEDGCVSGREDPEIVGHPVPGQRGGEIADAFGERGPALSVRRDHGTGAEELRSLPRRRSGQQQRHARQQIATAVIEAITVLVA